MRANVQQCKLYLTTLYYIFELWPGGKSESSHYQKKKKVVIIWGDRYISSLERGDFFHIVYICDIIKLHTFNKIHNCQNNKK